MNPILKLNREQFVAKLSEIYEKSPWVAEQVWNKNLSDQQKTIKSLHIHMKNIVEEAKPEQKYKLLNNHPELSSNFFKKAGLTTASKKEQRGAGLDKCTPTESNELLSLNTRYRATFTFPFIIAVKGRTISDILEQLNKRLLNSPDIEFGIALNEVHNIALLRLMEVFGKPST